MMSQATHAVAPTPDDTPAAPTTLAGLLDDQRRRWRLGDETPVEAFLERHPGLIDRPEEALDLIYQEIVLREEAGQSPRLEEYQRRFPRWAAQLADQFEVHRAIESSGPGRPAMTSGSPSARGPDTVPAGRMVAGCEVLEVLGRGGMGVVYRAWQPGLNRVVALKMILAGAHASPAATARFRAEAEAVARLQHANIVQVFRLDEHDGLPCLVLEYVPGGTLAHGLDGTPLPPRRAAETAEILARAMHYAHGQGVVHRDLKPANVLLAADGTPRIADFGLAKLLEGAREALTRTGEVLGTPSYMAPEQAGGPARVGPAADVYALGAILYEMLTGRPPFRAETAQETLRQVVAEEPVPPGRLRPRLSRDLETICLRCLEKAPVKRYASAGDLADDLRRYLDGRPIRARRVGPVGRLARWAGRRPAVAALTAAVALLAAAGVVGLVLSSRNDRRLRLQAEARRVEAEENLSQARQVVDEMYTKVAAELEDRAGMDAYQRTLLEKALRFYRTFALRRSGAPEVRHEAGEAGLRVGDIAIKLGRVGEGVAAYRDAVGLLEPLAGEFPEVPRYRETLARVLYRAGQMARNTSRTAEAESTLRRAVAILERLAAEAPEVAGYRAHLVAAHGNLGATLFQTGRLAEAEEEYRKARDLNEMLVREEPRVALHRSALGIAYINLSAIALRTGQWDEARSDLQRAVAEYEKLAAYETKRADYPFDLAEAFLTAGLVACETGRWGESLVAYRRAESLYAGLVAEHPDVSPYRKGLAKVRLGLGELHRKTGRTDEAEASLRQAVSLWEKLVADEPEVAENRSTLAACLNDLGLVFMSSGRADEAEAAYRRAVPLYERLAADHPEQATFTVPLGAIYGNVAEICKARREHWAALDWLDRSRRALEGALQVDARLANARLYLRNAHGTRAQILGSLARHAEALADWDRALELQRGLVRDADLPLFHSGRAEVLTALGRHAEALADWDRALESASAEGREGFRIDRALTLARMGDHARATAEVAGVAGVSASPRNLYNAACVYAVSSSAVQDRDRSPSEREATAAGYAARAVAMLDRARRAGYFADAAKLAGLVSDPDLRLLRSTSVFRELLMDLAFPADPFASAR
jgi:tetratricopeptide (TPR) repeat protein